MAGYLRRLKRRAARLAASARASSSYERYAGRPVAYIREVLKQALTPDQEKAAEAAERPPYRVLCPSANNVGKSALAAFLTSYRFDCIRPGVTLTTAPTDRQVRRILWREVRRFRGAARLGGFAGPKIALLEAGPETFAEGFTARDAERFQGVRGNNVFLVFDEAEGVDEAFWEVAETLLGGDHYGFFGIYNPTMQSGPTADAERSGQYTVIRMSALDHPNIEAELAGKPPPFPSAIRLVRLREQIKKWCTRVEEPDPSLRDFEFPPGSGVWWRPGIVAQARLLGLRPLAGFDSVWAEWQFDAATARMSGGLDPRWPLQIGCDVARFGDDDTCFHVRIGPASVWHESVNGWRTTRTANRLMQLADRWGQTRGVDPKSVLLAVDDCGVGGGVTDILTDAGWNVVGVNTAEAASADEDYPNLRSALWFGMADACGSGAISFSRLAPEVQAELRRQFLAPIYALDTRGRRCVERKEDTKDRLKRSPDDADAVLLAYARVRPAADRVAHRIEVPT